MRKFNLMVMGFAVAAAVACDRGQKANLAGDTSLSHDLNLATQAQPYQRLDSTSALETTPSPERPAAAAPSPRTTASAPSSSRRAASSYPRRSSTRSSSTRTRTPSASSGRTTTASSGDVDVG